MSLNLMIGGEAGQGLVTIGEVLAKTMVRLGYRIVVTQDYESRVRGGHNTFAIRVSEHEILAPREQYDFLVALDQESVDRHLEELGPDAIVIADREIKSSGVRRLEVPYRELGGQRQLNVAAAAILGSLIGLDHETLAGVVDERFGKKPEAREKNRQVLAKALDFAARADQKFFRRLPAVNGGRRLLLNSNELIAMGALSAGLKFYAFYPMTPSTSIAVALVKAMDRAGIVVEQGEDEIAVINMAIGASYAGAPAMVGTSGGGFALMVEGVSLAAMTETPIVIVVGQRPGPATGLPTRTEQADLEFVLHAGHGEFPRAILAPGTGLQFFHLTRKALFMAEKYQGPVFILTDQQMADYMWQIEPVDLDPLDTVKPGADPGSVETPYRRYRVTDNGVSPRLLPGASRHLAIADSDEHDADGHITEGLETRVEQWQKRMRKLEGLKSEVEGPEYVGPEDPDLLLVCWGSARGACVEAKEELEKKGTRTAVLHFHQVWPLMPDRFLTRLEAARRVVAVESNGSAQFARLIRRETGFHVQDRVLRYDGRPLTPEYILRGLERRGG